MVYVAYYMVDKAYGGPEEGGWWYDYGVLLDKKIRAFKDKEAAYNVAGRLQELVDYLINENRLPTYSVLSEGRIDVIVTDEPPANWPASRPYYC